MAGMTENEFSELPIEKTFEIIKEFKSTAGIASFFKQASQ
jgi:hypothetical protein